MIIGVTGLMGSGKTTLCREIIKNNPEIVYINVDELRSVLIEDSLFMENLSKLLNKNIKDRASLNEEIYSNEKSMNVYKTLLCKKLTDELSKYKSETVLVEWALIIKDNLINMFDKLIIINFDTDYILKNRKFDDLSKEEVKRRLDIQSDQFLDFSDIGIPYLIHKDLEETINFIREGE